MNKICCKCRKEKPATIEFFRIRNSKCENPCKICVSEYNKKRDKKLMKNYNKSENAKLSKKKWKENNSNYDMDYYIKNKEKCNNNSKQWYKDNKEYFRKYVKNYQIKIGKITGTGQTIPEQQIEQFLIENNITYIQEKSFNNCINHNGNLLNFDFWLPELNILIEYDGKNHYEPIFGVNKLTEQQKNDNVKNNYCKENNINLVRIPYWENISIKLRDKLCII